MNKGMQRGMGFLVVLLLGIFLFSSFALAAYDDIGSYWGKDSIEKWSEKGIIEGTENHFRPGDKITRGEFAVILDRIMDYQLTSSVQFSDLGDKFYKDAILKCNKANVLQGSGDTVRPNDYITRQEAFVMICRAFYIEESNNSSADFADKSQISSWAMGSINALVNKGYIKGDKNKINPQGDLTRGEAVTLIDNIIEELYCKEAVYDKDVQGNLIINSNKVILRNMNIKGNLILAPGVNKDAVILDNVKIDGYIIISGGDNKLLTLQGKTSYNKLYIVKNGQLSEVKQNQEEAKKPVVEEDSPGGSTITSKQQIAFLGKKLEAEVAIAEPIIANRANLLVFWKEYTDHVTNAKRVITNIKYDSLKYLPEFDTPQEISALLDNIHTYNLLVKDYNDTYNNGNILKNRYVTYYPEENKAQYKLYYNSLLMRLDQVQKAAVYDAKIADIQFFLQELKQGIADMGIVVDTTNKMAITDAQSWENKADNILLHWQPLVDSLSKVKDMTSSKDNIAKSNAAQELMDLTNLVAESNSVYQGAQDLLDKKDSIPNQMEGAADKVAAVMAKIVSITTTSSKEDVVVYFAELKEAAKYLKPYAIFVGDTQVTAQDIRNNGINWEIQVKNAELTYNNNQKRALIGNLLNIAWNNSMVIDLDPNTYNVKEGNKLASGLYCDYDEGMLNDGKRGNLAYIKTINSSNAFAINGESLKDDNNAIRFLKIGNLLKQEIITSGTVSINAAGNLQIQCPATDKLKEFSNNLSWVNGGLPFAFGDLPVSLNIPKSMLKGATENCLTDNSFNIIEQRAHVELYQYNDLENKNIDNITKIDHLTESDIHQGGKLVKVIVDSRCGPSRWALDKKYDPAFIKNGFRAVVDDYINDDPQWLKVETALGGDLPKNDKNLKNWNGYLKKLSSDNRGDVLNPAVMWFIFEIPAISDFSIEQDMNIYISLLQGMVGGSGGGGSNPQGYPFWGQSGVSYFTIENQND